MSSALIALVCLLAGIAIGALFGRWLSPQERQRRELAESLHRQQREAAEYQQRVTEHFVKTSELVNNFAQSYREVHQHLAVSAMHLANPEVGRALLNAAAGQLALKLDPEPHQLEPPRDYSPKKGALGPSFGFDDNEPAAQRPSAMAAPPLPAASNLDREDDPTLKVS